MGPTNPQSFQSTPNNPFLQLLSKLQSQGTQQAPGNNPGMQAMLQRVTQPAGASPAPQTSPPGGAPVGADQGTQPTGIEDAAIPGSNPGTTKQLLQAANALHGAITQMSDPQEIQMIRSILMLLSNLIQRDQQVQNTRTGTMTGQQPGTPNFSTGQAPAGEPMTPPTGGPMGGVGGSTGGGATPPPVPGPKP